MSSASSSDSADSERMLQQRSTRVSENVAHSEQMSQCRMSRDGEIMLLKMQLMLNGRFIVDNQDMKQLVILKM